MFNDDASYVPGTMIERRRIRLRSVRYRGALLRALRRFRPVSFDLLWCAGEQRARVFESYGASAVLP